MFLGKKLIDLLLFNEELSWSLAKPALETLDLCGPIIFSSSFFEN